jgi:hypothetical protein
MQAKFNSLLRGAGLAGAALLLSGALASGAEPSDDFPRFESYIKLSGHAAEISGNDASYQKRTQRAKNGGVGVEDLHIYKDLSKTDSVVIDGRALVGEEDYLAQFKLTRQNVGSLEAGYKRFRVFYDGIGGFFPLNRAWFPLTQEDLHLDRGRLWVEGKLALKDAPVFTLRYVNETRNGKKDSTHWGDSNLTGLPLLPANNATRKILPAYLWLGERHELLEGRVEHTIAKTRVSFSVVGEWTRNLDRLFVTNFKGEGAAERVLEQAKGDDSDSWGATLTTETELSKTVTLNTGFSYHKLDSSIYGERPTAIGLVPTYAFKDLSGGSDFKVYTANASLQFRPGKAWQVQTTLRFEDNYTKSAATFTSATQPRNSPITAPITTAQNFESSRVKEQILTPDVSVRYTGINHVVIYGSFSNRLNDGDERAISPYTTAAPAVTNIFKHTVDQDQAHYKLGSNINVSSGLILRGEVFHKEHENRFTGYDNRLGSLYVVGYRFTGLKLTGIVRPLPQLSFTTRYQPQKGRMHVTTEATSRFQSMDAEAHMIGETIDWNPNKTVFVQANANVVFNSISSAYPSSANPNQRNADNNYRTGSLIGGCALSKTTDGTLEYTYQKADNFLPELAAYTQPYGAGYTEHSVTIGVKHRLSPKWIGTAKLGYIDSKNATTGGNTNFRGPIGYLSIERAL